MATIEVDFEVFKALTALRPSEATTYNDIVRTLLKLEVPQGGAESGQAFGGCEFKGVYLPNGTQLRVTYKGVTHTAEIQNGSWVGGDGVRRNSPSDAACAITSTNVNGWRFWRAKRPQDNSWKLLADLRASAR